MSTSYAGLRNYAAAYPLAENALNLENGNRALIKWTMNLERRVQEEAGHYDWARFLKLSKDQPDATLPFADFHNSCIEVKDSAGKGRGFFAKCMIPAGQLLLVEKAFAIANGTNKSSS